MPTKDVAVLMEQVRELKSEIRDFSEAMKDLHSIKADMVWVKRGVYIVGTALAGQIMTAVAGLLK